MNRTELLAEIEQKNAAVRAFFDSPESENPTKERIEEIKDTNKRIEELEVKAAELLEFEGLKAKANERERTTKTPVRNIPFEGERGQDGHGSQSSQSEAPASLGHIFTENPAVKQFLDQFEGRHVSDRMQINTPKVELKAGLKDLQQKALITGLSDTSAGAFVRTSYMDDIALPYRELSLRDVITVGRVNSDAIEYARATGTTNNAATVAEATATSGGTGVKPESDMAFEKVTATVRTIAHWMAVSNQALSDANQIRTYINSFLVQGLEEEVEDQLMTDLAALTGISTEAYDTSLLKTTRKAITTAREQHARPTGWLMSLTDWESFDLLADGETRYYFGGPMVLGNPRLWGYPVIASEAVPTGFAYTGDLKTIVMWEREQATLSMTNSHSDFFIRNLVAILAEMRVAFGFLRPAAIVKVDLTA
jgi:HK97 family phage major capsid protein